MSLASNLITVVSTVIVMVAINWELTLVSLFVLPWLAIPTRKVGTLRRQLRSRRQKKLADMSAFLQEMLSISGNTLIKAFGRERAEEKKFHDQTTELRDLQIREALVGRWFFMTPGVITAVGPAIIYWYGGRQVINGDLTIGTIVAFVALLGRLYSPATSFANLHVEVITSLSFFERIFQSLDLVSEVRDSPDSRPLEHPRGEVRFEKVGFEYVSGRPVLSEVSFGIKPGELAALVGPSGAGKTTVTYLLPRLYDVTAGGVLIDGVDVRDLRQRSIRENIGMVTQETFLLHASVRDNLTFAKSDATQTELEEACKAAHLHDFITTLPEGYDTVVGERGYRLSGGEKQRLAIARVILKDPTVFILDEATSSLDTLSESLIQDAIRPLLHSRTSLVIAHRLSTIIEADKILVMNHGSVVEQGTHNELFARDGLYRRLYEETFKAGTIEPAAD